MTENFPNYVYLVNKAMRVPHTSKFKNGHKPLPVGAITLRQAARTYDVASATLSRWVRKGLIPVIMRTANELYVNEEILAKVVSRYKAAPGKGKHTIKAVT